MSRRIPSRGNGGKGSIARLVQMRLFQLQDEQGRRAGRINVQARQPLLPSVKHHFPIHRSGTNRSFELHRCEQLCPYRNSSLWSWAARRRPHRHLRADAGTAEVTRGLNCASGDTRCPSGRPAQRRWKNVLPPGGGHREVGAGRGRRLKVENVRHPKQLDHVPRARQRSARRRREAAVAAATSQRSSVATFGGGFNAGAGVVGTATPRAASTAIIAWRSREAASVDALHACWRMSFGLRVTPRATASCSGS